MTKEEAKLVLDNARPQTKEIDRQFYDDEDLNNAIDMAIKALEQQSSEDCVSRQAAIDMAKSYNTDGYDSYTPLVVDVEDIEDLPPVTPTIPSSDDCVSREQVLRQMKEWRDCEFVKMTNPYHYLEKRIQSMPPVTPTHGTCKDCHNAVKNYGNGRIYCLFSNCIYDEDFWCKKFEKRGNEE